MNRPAGTAATTQTYSSPGPARVGTFLLTIQFYSEAGGTGSDVGFARASTTVLPNGALTVTISTYTGIQSVELAPNQSVEVGETKDLVFTARNAQGAIVPVSDAVPGLKGAVFFNVVQNSQNLGVVNGGSSVQGLHPVSALVTARIDTAVSAPVLVNVTSGTAVAVTPSAMTIGSEFPLDITAAVTNAPAAESDVTWSIDEGAGVQFGTLTSVGGNAVRYLAPKVVDTDVRTVHVTATSKYNTNRKATTTITVNAPATVVITPGAAALSWEESINLSAVVNNISPLITDANNQQVKWEIVKQGANPVGTLLVDPSDPNKVTYTAPKRDATIVVRAISNYDTTKIGTITIQVSTKVTVVAISPNPLPDPIKISVARTQDFGVQLSNIPAGKDGSVTWTVTGPNGEANTGGIYGSITATSTTTARYTAPTAQPGSGFARIVATSNYDTSATRIINVQIVGGSLGIKIN